MYQNKKYAAPSLSQTSEHGGNFPRKNILRTIAMLCIACCTVFFALCKPNICKAALLVGYEICVSQLLFALFPFLIAANLIVLCGLAPLLARPLRPLFRCLGFREPCAAAIFMLALLGGFAPAVSALSQSVSAGQISHAQAARLLPAICFLGPSYIIVAVGEGMLGNLQCGLYLFISQVVASLLVTLLFRLFQKRRKRERNDLTAACCSPQAANEPPFVQMPSANQLQSFNLSHMIGDAFFAFLRLCGVILYFQFLSAGVASFFPEQSRWICETMLEVTAACSSISNLGTAASYRCCAALSLLSASILLQIVALCPKGVSCKQLFYARALHLPAALIVFRLLLFIPQTQSVYNSLPTRVIAMPRLPLDQAVLLFTALVFLVQRLHKPLQRP